MDSHGPPLPHLPQRQAALKQVWKDYVKRMVRLREVLGELYHDERFAALSPTAGQLAYAPWHLTLVTVLQYLENLTDRQAANAVRDRIAWKDLLGLQ